MYIIRRSQVKFKMPRKLIDLTGKKFDRLLVLEIGRRTPSGTIMWKCLCDCGNISFVSRTNLVKRNVVSCGCLKRERMRLPEGTSSFNKIFYTYKYNAKLRNLPFELKEEEFKTLLRGDCFYCGRKPEQIFRMKYNNGDFVHNGVDRLDSSKGYTLDNCVSCCTRCNRAKLLETKDNFFAWVRQVYNHSIINKEN